jgi:hypothetical protein
MTKKNLLALILSLCSYSIHVFAQNNEVSLSVGGVFATDQTATTQLNRIAIPCPPTNPGCGTLTSHGGGSSGVAFVGNFARRITAFGPASFYVEAPVVGGPDRNTTVSFRNGTLLGDAVIFSSSSLFFAPSAKFKFLESSRISPFASVGGGLAHLGLASSSRNTGALQFGGGLDFKSRIPHLGFRVEARDFFSGGNFQSSSMTHVSPSHQHVVFAGGGAVFRF